MKKFIKSLLFIFIIFSFIFIPRNVFATTSSDYMDVHDVIESFRTDSSNVKISDIRFFDHSDSKNPYFCLSGVINRKDNKTYHIFIKTSYYDSNYNLIASGSDSDGDDILNDRVYLSAFNTSISMIKYYKIEVTTYDDNTYNNLPENKDYLINGYNIGVKVNKNHSFDINENINVHFNKERHGIYRSLPIYGNIYRNDGSNYKYFAKVSNVNVNDVFHIDKGFNEEKIYIGNEEETIVGDKNYVISYLYSLSDDDTKKYDEVYLNLIGSEWDSYISNITFKIDFPSKFNKSKIGFSTGNSGTIGSNDVTYKVDGNSIIGNVNKTLSPNQALTIRVELPDGYFTSSTVTKPKSNNILKNVGALYSFKFEFNFVTIFLLVIIVYKLFSVIFSFILWMSYGKKNKEVKTIEFYPPEGMNCLELALKYRGYVRSKDIITLLISLSNKGYIKIIDKEDKNFIISKVREYDGTDEIEKIFYDGLFEKWPTLGDVITNNSNGESLNEIDSKTLLNYFYVTINNILKKLNKDEKTNVVVDKKARAARNLIGYSCTNTAILMSCLFSTHIPEVFYIVCLYFIGYGLFKVFKLIYKNELDKKIIILTLINALFIIGISLIAFIYKPELGIDVVFSYGYLFIINGICDLIMFIFYKIFEVRNTYGLQIHEKIEGFKDFLSVCEKDKIDSLLRDNPKYLYYILPYIYVLDLDDIWINKFECLYPNTPDWYVCSNTNNNNINYFMYSINSNIDSIKSSIPSNSSSGSGGGSSSGGSTSSGGAGGGGGGSW